MEDINNFLLDLSEEEIQERIRQLDEAVDDNNRFEEENNYEVDEENEIEEDDEDEVRAPIPVVREQLIAGTYSGTINDYSRFYNMTEEEQLAEFLRMENLQAEQNKNLRLNNQIEVINKKQKELDEERERKRIEFNNLKENNFTLFLNCIGLIYQYDQEYKLICLWMKNLIPVFLKSNKNLIYLNEINYNDFMSILNHRQVQKRLSTDIINFIQNKIVLDDSQPQQFYS